MLVTSTVVAFWLATGGFWHKADYWLLDSAYRSYYIDGHHLLLSDRILYVVLTDQSTRPPNSLKINRSTIARIVRALADLGVSAIVLDFIMDQPGHPEWDQSLADALLLHPNVFLPVAIDFSVDRQLSLGRSAVVQRYLAHALLDLPEGAYARPNIAFGKRVLLQEPQFMASTRGTGHINVTADEDGVFRHLYAVLGLHDHLLPSFAFGVYLKSMEVATDQVQIFQDQIRIPSDASPWIEDDVIVPIDASARVFVPITSFWQGGFPKMDAAQLLDLFTDTDIRGNLEDLFAEKIIIVADVSTGTISTSGKAVSAICV